MSGKKRMMRHRSSGRRKSPFKTKSRRKSPGKTQLDIDSIYLVSTDMAHPSAGVPSTRIARSKSFIGNTNMAHPSAGMPSTRMAHSSAGTYMAHSSAGMPKYDPNPFTGRQHMTKMAHSSAGSFEDDFESMTEFSSGSNPRPYGSTRRTQKQQEPIHHGVMCDGCRQDPLVGPRYKCRQCADFDLCQKCVSTRHLHHRFLTIFRPPSVYDN